jgi:ferritin-like metal-binding protein YciE
MPQIKNAEQLAAKGLKQIHSAERQLMREVPKLSRSVQHDGLRQMLDRRREMGEQLVEDLDEIFDEIDVRTGRSKNHTAEGLIADVHENLDEIEDAAVRDAALIAGVQKLLHYCIAAWGTARSMGQLLGQERVVEVMQRVLDDGKRMDQELTDLAEREVNPMMTREGGKAQATA